MPSRVPPRRPHRPLIDLLREELLQLDDGAALGSEASLQERLRVSRSSLRQAARVLEREQLLEVRRGIRGGYYARRPDVTGVAQAAVNFLRFRGAKWSDLIAAGRVITADICKLAAANPDPIKRERLNRAMRRLDSLKTATRREFVRADIALQSALLALADNAFLELYQSISWGFGVNQKKVRIWDRDDHRIRWSEERLALCGAVLRGETEVAAAFANRAYMLIATWIDEARNGEELDVRAGMGTQVAAQDEI